MEHIDLTRASSNVQGNFVSARHSLRQRTLDKENCKDLLNKTVALEDQRVSLRKHNFRTTVHRLTQYNVKEKRSATQNRPRMSIPRPANKENQIEVESIYSDSTLLTNYQLMSHIGKGAYATVSSAVEKITGKNVAIKIYEKLAIRDPQRMENIKRQIKNLKLLKHRNIVNIIHAINDKRKVFLIMQNAGKNSLHSLIRRRQNKRFSQLDAKHYFSQLLQALSWCHRHNICHRDIKLQNILVNDSSQVKLIDFGFSVQHKGKLNTYCGTPSYMAPEIAGKGSYQGWQVDMWSCGVLLYVMLCGCFPFRGIDEKELYRKIRGGKYMWKEELNVSVGAKRVVSRLLRVPGEMRCPADQLLFDKWFSQ